MNIKKKQFFRQILTGVLCSAVIITQAVPVFATDEYGAPLVTATPTPDPHTPYYKQPADTDSIKDWTKGPQIEGESAILVDMFTGAVLYSKNADKAQYPASITKIMTAMLALKYGNMDDTVTISQENVTLESGSQVAGFQAGDQVTMDQLLHCLLVYSANDAASAIAEHIGGSTDKFVEMMNSFAAELGCTGTHFTNPHGLQDENHYTTPYDIYLMLKEALNYPEFTDITQMASYTVSYKHSDGSDASATLPATDHYLTGEAATPKDVTILGGKTGTTDKAGNCLALLSQNAYGKPFISIVMGASSKDVLYQEMTSLLHTKNKKADLFEILFRRSAFLFFFLHSVNFYCIIGAITAGIFGLTAIKIRIRSTTVIIVIDHFT